MNKHLQWLIQNKTTIKINAIEKQLSMPQGTLKKFVDGNRCLTEDWQLKVIAWIKNFKR